MAARIANRSGPEVSETAVRTGVLDLDRCRELLGPDCALSPQELRSLVEDLGALATVLLELYREAALQGVGFAPGLGLSEQPN
jgi:hypothetical protein